MRCSLFAFPDKNNLLRISKIRFISFGALLFWILSYSSLTFSVNEIKYNGKLALRKNEATNKLVVLNAIQEESDRSNSEITGLAQQAVLQPQQPGIAMVAFSDQRFLFIRPDREGVIRELSANQANRQSRIAEIAQTPAGYQVHVRRVEQQNIEGGADVSDEQLSALALNPYLVQRIRGSGMSGQQQRLSLRSTGVPGNYFLAERDDRYYPVRIRQPEGSLQIDFGERNEAVATGSEVAIFTINQVSDVDIVRAFQGQAVDPFSPQDLLPIVQRVEVPGIIFLAYAPRCGSAPEISRFINNLAFDYRWSPLQAGCMISAMSPVDWEQMQRELNSDLDAFLASIYSVLSGGNPLLHSIDPEIISLVLALVRCPGMDLLGIGIASDIGPLWLRLVLLST